MRCCCLCALCLLLVGLVGFLLLWGLRYWQLKSIKNSKVPHHLPEAPSFLSKKEQQTIKEIHLLLDDLLEGQSKDDSYETSAQRVSNMLTDEKAGRLFTTKDVLRSNSKKLFTVHRECPSRIEGGLAIRMTVQFNLFAGSVANLGNDQQREWLKGTFERGELGCFGLTESSAGVLSGLVVQTIATWTPEGYVLSSPDPMSSRKSWISQGLTAKWGVIFARLKIPGPDGEVDKGPHGFIVDLDTEGVVREDMAPKTAFNSLDNAYLYFEDVSLPHDSLLSGISYVDEKGKYHNVDPEVVFKFVTVAQRLLSGRICISGAAINQLMYTHRMVEEYGKTRHLITGRDVTTPLSSLPMMRDVLFTIKTCASLFRNFTFQLENEFMSIPEISDELTHKIACAKIEALNFAINSTELLKRRVGSYSLQKESPFGYRNDLLYVLRFAEGDSNILQQKMVRDDLKNMSVINLLKTLLVEFPLQVIKNKDGLGFVRAQLCLERVQLAVKMMQKGQRIRKWLESYDLIERISHKIALLTIFDSLSSSLQGSAELAAFKQHVVAPLCV